ncbi:hypothetical protein COX86_02500 [Candidatus Micrarchaeota archaeon CG_4_10_14_0_2_um_filter_60_11]|nr:MAG: hypothetical protein AUJ16_00100 [Candidatus Micrarchaeota archaeon CG1_02_60_51]PIN96136.1 MAG: hypothetical protein COU39_02480 [Candidatus Micrarchaeota archaeon CG10_big_fil_rev_8_21_14_0_10_60_32]PIO02103.1 MAG: hypothetical protein COT58_01810 [Candidatus Micrarchaeota archaeon CG09_land_8_20_14_0_10_60_16]PIY91280.1 MAG: hypothetical protein COY71_03995 [Candidatus Micrarchaeota archaeon CG_4_10_14_0_8_um_filter_60_7]PIZ90882.1 MAG: hypothetical protein COX86_02500 [Candidatus Mi
MRFKVLKTTADGSLLLEPEGKAEAIRDRRPLFLKGERVAVVVDTIASVDAPLYLARPSREVPSGKILDSRD